MKVRRVHLAVFSIITALVVATVGSYYGFIVRDGNSERNVLPQYAVGAVNIVKTHAYTGQPDDYSSVLKHSELVVEGVIDEIFPAQWSTSNGDGPDTLIRGDVKNIAIHIRTPVQLSVKRVFKGESVGDTLKFSFIGGRVSNTAHIFEWNEVFEEGTRVIVFLGKGSPGSPSRNIDPQGLYPRMHLVVKGDVVQGPIKDIPIQEFLQQLQ